MTPNDKAIQAVVEVLIAGPEWCECRHSPFDKHDVNPPCSTRRRATEQARAALEAAAPHLKADAWDEGRKHGARYPYGKRGPGTHADDNPYQADQ
jgi:hypothetical protein